MSDDQAAAILAAIQRLEAGQQRLEAGQESLRSELAAVRGDVMNLRTELAAVRGDVTNLRTELTNVRTDVMGKLERIDDALTAIREDISVNMGAVQHTRRMNDNTRDELRGVVNIVEAMQRQILRIESEVAELRRKSEP